MSVWFTIHCVEEEETGWHQKSCGEKRWTKTKETGMSGRSKRPFRRSMSGGDRGGKRGSGRTCLIRHTCVGVRLARAFVKGGEGEKGPRREQAVAEEKTARKKT